MGAKKLATNFQSANASVVIFDSNESSARELEKELASAGFHNVDVASDRVAALAMIEETSPALVYVDLYQGCKSPAGLDFVRELRRSGFTAAVAIVTDDNMSEQFFRAARAGANDYLIKGVALKIGVETDRILTMKPSVDEDAWCPAKIQRLGFFSTQGLTAREIEILSEFAEDFPRHSQLAARLGRAEIYIRKVFSRIYEKLNLDTLSQLVQILTICEMYELSAPALTE